jgi:hypothetical protein
MTNIVPIQQQPPSLRSFNRFTKECDELLDYAAELRRGEHTAAAMAADAEAIDTLIARCRAGFARFDRAEHYETDDGVKVLARSHIARRLGVLLASFPAANPGTPDGYVRMLVEHIAVVEDVCAVTLESTCRAIVETKNFAPAIAEVIELLTNEIELWAKRRGTLRSIEDARALGLECAHEREAEERERERKKIEQERREKVERAEAAVIEAAYQVAQVAQQIETAETKLARLHEQHAAAKRREAEADALLTTVKAEEMAEEMAKFVAEIAAEEGDE